MAELDQHAGEQLLNQLLEFLQESPSNYQPKWFYSSKQWRKYSRWYRNKQDWQCEACKLSLSEPPKDREYLDTHHLKGTRYNNPEDLQALCIGCHSEQSGKNHERLKTEDRYCKFMEKYGDDWTLMKKSGGPEKAVGWIQDKRHNWFLLDDLPIDAPDMNCYGVYIIWYFDENRIPVVVRTGIKNSQDHLIVMRYCSAVGKYADHGLYITWAKVGSGTLERIWAYLCEKLKPLESPRCCWRDDPLPINLPE